MNIFCAFSSVFLTISTIFYSRGYDSVRPGNDRFTQSYAHPYTEISAYSKKEQSINIGPKY